MKNRLFGLILFAYKQTNIYLIKTLFFKILKNLQISLQNFNSRAQVDVVAIEATAVVIQSLLIALYVDPSDIKAVEQAIGAVI